MYHTNTAFTRQLLYSIVLLTLVPSPRGVTDPQAPREDIPLGRHARPDSLLIRSLQRWEFPDMGLTAAVFMFLSYEKDILYAQK